MMTIVMIMVINGMMMMMKINFLTGTMVIKNGRLKKPQQKKSSYPLLGIHEDIGIGARRRKKRDQKMTWSCDWILNILT